MGERPLTLIIPVYNEAGAVADTAARIARMRKKLHPDTEVIFVNDGSTDGSARILDEQCADHGFTLLQHHKNRGYGASLKTGIRAARHNVIAITDADGTYPLEKIPALSAPVLADEADMVVGTRRVAHQPMLRQPPKYILRKLAEYLTGEHIPDMNSGLRVFLREDALRHATLLPDGFSFTTTITMALLTEGRRVLFSPIRYEARVGSSKIKPIRDTANFAMLICRTALTFNPMKVFGPAGLFLIGMGILFLVARIFVDEAFGVATTITLLVGGFQMLAIGLLADLVNRRGQ